MTDQTVTSTASTADPHSASATRKGRLKFLAIIALFVLPFVVLPLIMSPDKMKKNNKGLLLEPHVQFAELQVRDMANNPVSAVPEKKWTMLYVVPARCKDSCIAARKNALVSMRQVRLSLQRDMQRVQPMLLFTESPNQEFMALLQNEFPTMVKLQVNREILDKQITSASTAGNIYLMSPDGYVFVYYPPYENDQDALLHAQDIHDDLKKSIKGSRI